jgi:hypothetical protein
MLQIIQSPAAVTFVKNDIVFRLRTVHPLDGQSYRAHGSRVAVSASNIPSGTELVLSFSEPSTISQSVSFQVTDNPSLLTDIQAPASLEAVMAVMANQPIVSPFVRFYLNPQGNELIAEAIDTNKEWVINITGAGTATPFLKAATNAPAGYKLNCDIFFEKNHKLNNFEKVASREISHREDGICQYF